MSLNYRIHSQIQREHIRHCGSYRGRYTSTGHLEGHVRHCCGSYRGRYISTGHMEGHVRHCCGSCRGRYTSTGHLEGHIRHCCGSCRGRYTSTGHMEGTHQTLLWQLQRKVHKYRTYGGNTSDIVVAATEEGTQVQDIWRDTSDIVVAATEEGT